MSPQEKIKKLKKLQDVLILKDEKSIHLSSKIDLIFEVLDSVVNEMKSATKDFVAAVPKINEPVIVDQTVKLQEILREVKKKDIIDLSISPELRQKLKGDKGDSIKGDRGDNGEKGDKGEKGENGDIKNLSPEEIRDALELLQDDERLKIEAIKDLREELDELKKLKGGIGYGGGGSAGGVTNHLDIYDLSTQTNGVLKTFSVPGLAKPYYIIGSDFPTVLFPNNGFTYSAVNNTVTLTTDNAPSTGSQLGLMYSY